MANQLFSLALLVACSAAPAAAAAGGFGASQMQAQLPLDYVQSGFMLGSYDGGFPALSGDLPAKTAAVAKMAKEFQGSEILLGDLRTPQAMQDIASGIAAIRAVSQSADPALNPRGKPFYGYYIVSRPLGFFWPGEVPAQWTSNALKSDGSSHFERPCNSGSNLYGCGSISINGWTFDVGDAAAVAAFLQKNFQAFRANTGAGNACTPGVDCTGPLYGFVAFNETTLSGNYGDFLNGPDYSDMAPADYAQTDNHLKFPKLGDPAGGAPGYWMLDAMLGGNQELPNGDSFMSYLHGPKRMIPLFSKADRDSFVAFARARLPARTDIDRLPADRVEFDYDDAALQRSDPGPLGPNGWVKFVPLSDKDYWSVWDDWVFSTWSNFLTAWAKSFADAQAGNPDFHGSLYFDFPGWWALRGAAAQQTVSYSYVDTATGKVVSATGRPLDAPQDSAGKPAYDALNPVTRGTDLSVVLASPYFAGFLHETTNEMPGPKSGATREQMEDNDYNSDVHRYLFMMMGQAAKQLAQANGKLFGAFVRWGTIGWPNDSPGQMPVDLFQKVNFQRVIDVLQPDVVATLPPAIYLQDPPLGQSGCAGLPNCYAQTWLDGLAQLAALEGRAPSTSSATIVVNSSPSGADVYISTPNASMWTFTGRQTPATLAVPAGTYGVMLLKSGYLSWSISPTSVAPGGTWNVATALTAGSGGSSAVFTAPVEGGLVGGTTTLALRVYDNSGKGVKSVELRLYKGSTWSSAGFVSTLATLTAAPYSYSWDSKTVADGTYTVLAVVTTGDGQSGALATTFAVSNGQAQALQAAVSSPQDGQTVSGPTEVQAQTCGAPSRVELYEDGALVGNMSQGAP